MKTCKNLSNEIDVLQRVWKLEIPLCDIMNNLLLYKIDFLYKLFREIVILTWNLLVENFAW